MKRKFFLNLGMAVMSLLAISCTTADGDSYNVLDSEMYNGNGIVGGFSPSLSGDKFSEFADNPFVKTSLQPISTFSVDADGASYAIVRHYLDKGFTVNPSSVRI